MSAEDDVADLAVGPNEAPKLPNMNEFSPGVLEGFSIRRLLTELRPLEGAENEQMREWLATNVPSISRTPDTQRLNRANNVLIGMSQCGLLEKDGARISTRLSDVARRILDAPTDVAGSDVFAAHLIENCHGRDLMEVVQIIRARGDDVSLQRIREELRSRGFEVTENEGNASKIRKWLEQAGIFRPDWSIDDARLIEVTGASSPTLAKWSGLTRGQRVFLQRVRELSVTEPPEWLPVRPIKTACETMYGRAIFPEGRLRADVIQPLVGEGWIEVQGIGEGRGGDSGSVRALRQLTDIGISLPVDTASSIPAELVGKLGTPVAQIFADLESPDTHVKGIALELLALRILRDINLYPAGFRVRGVATGGAEVDIIANGIHLHYSRWLVQCKNTDLVHVSAIAKEAGMALVLRAQVIMLISTGRFARSVKDFATTLAKTSAMQAVLIDQTVLTAYREKGASAIQEYLESNARQVLRLKDEQRHGATE